MVRWYNSRWWRRQSHRCRRRHPFCTACTIKRPATVAHHRKPLSLQALQSFRQFKAESSLDRLTGLCRDHHEAEHNRAPQTTAAEREFLRLARRHAGC